MAFHKAARNGIKVPWRTHAHLQANSAGKKIVAHESQDKQVGTFPVGDLGKPELNSLAEQEEVRTNCLM